MAKYTVKTDRGTVVFEADQSDLTQEEVAEIVGRLPIASASPTEPSSPKEPTPIRDALGIDSTASMGTQVAQGASTMFRGTRGLGVVGANLAPLAASAAANPVGTLMRPQDALDKVGNAIQRGAEAVKPGFKPQGAAETIGSAVGESGPLLPLGGPMAAGVRGAAMLGVVGAGQSALMQQSERGSIDPAEVGITAGLTALVPALPQIIRNNYPAIAQWSTKVPKEAFQRMMDDPSFLRKFSGSVEQIQKRAGVVFDAFKKAEDGVRNLLNNAQEYYSLKPTIAEAREVADAGPMTIAKIWDGLDSVKSRMRDKVVKTTFEPASGVAKKEIQKAYTPREKLVRLIRLDKQLNNITHGSLDDDTKKLKDAIAAEIVKVDGGEYIQKVRTMWSEFRDVADKLGKNLADEDASKIVLKKLANGDITGALSVGNVKAMKAIKELEKMTGLPSVIEPLKDELMAGMVKRTAPAMINGRDYLEKALMWAFPKVGIPMFAASSPRLMSSLIPAVKALPIAAQSGAMATSGLMRGNQ